ncbi:hypothetical protein ACFE04_026352 [Oxalis oulophora]
METYKRWVRRNKDYVHSLESLANGLTWLLPERFSSSEIGPEAVTSLFGIMTAINDHIIETAPQRHGSSIQTQSQLYSLCISVLKDLETLVEVVAEQYVGVDKKWNFIAVTEAAKVLVRLAMFQNSGYKMLLQGGETPNVEDSSLQDKPENFQNSNGVMGNGHGPAPWNLEGRALSALNRFGENARRVSDTAWPQRVHPQRAVIEPPKPPVDRPTLSAILSEKGFCGGLFLSGEVLFILRPLIYVLMIRKYGVRSWIPWLLSLSVDVFGMGFHSIARKQFHLSSSEKDELKRRKLLWALYLMRDPFFSKYTRQKLESTEKVLEPVPLVGFLSAKVVELLSGAQTRIGVANGLSMQYYTMRCPMAEFIIKNTVNQALQADPTLAAALVHNTAEKDSPGNLSVRGYEVIDDAKDQVESQCPGVVSCADIIAMAARDAIFWAGGPVYDIPKGRKDGRRSKIEDTINLPFPTFNASELITVFSKRGFTAQEMVALSGAHTLGVARCSSFKGRLSSSIDPNMDSDFAKTLSKTCTAGDNAEQPLDPTRNTFDNFYYNTLIRKSGVLFSDQTLYTNPRTRAVVNNYALNQAMFFFDFQQAMVKMSTLDVKEGSRGEVRDNCRKIN